MDREEFTNFIIKLERKYPVNEWQMDGVHLWPLIKIKLSFAFNAKSKKPSEIDSKESTLNKTKKAVKGLFYFSKILLGGKTRIATTLYCLAPHFRYYDGSRYINRYFNQLITKSIDKDSDFLMVEYGNTTEEYRKAVDYPDKTIYFENLKYLALFLRELSWKKYSRKVDWLQFDYFLNEVNAELKEEGKSLSKNDIVKQFVYIKKLKSLYTPILLKWGVKEVYILCYYVSEMYAMNLATSDLGITSWDIQHGGQGSMHIAYTNFNAIPQSGYKLLPRKFWTWDSASASEISKWVSTQVYHEVQERGNPWIEHCIQSYSSELDLSKKIILYTMQPLDDDLLDEYIIETIKKTPSDYIWWLRLHPRQLSEKKKLETLLNVNGILNRVNINEASTLPLPGILSKTNIHLSKFSGSILEAYIMSVRTIILSNVGVESFPDVVKSPYGLIHLEQDSRLLLQLIITKDSKSI